MNPSKLAAALIPPAIAWRLGRKSREAGELERFQAFYASFLQSGDLCFDIGANLGNRLIAFRSLGCRVVGVEPQSKCFARLEERFGGDPEVVLIRKAVAETITQLELQVSPDHVLSTLSPDFIERTTRSGRFAGVRWDHREMVETTTLDQMIADHGMPRFIKIDVEGFESQVLAGLSQPGPAVSFEWTPEFPENARACVEHLASLGDYEFAVSWAETMKLSAVGWRDATSILRCINEFAGETFLFGDIYARLRGA